MDPLGVSRHLINNMQRKEGWRCEQKTLIWTVFFWRSFRTWWSWVMPWADFVVRNGYWLSITSSLFKHFKKEGKKSGKMEEKPSNYIWWVIFIDAWIWMAITNCDSAFACVAIGGSCGPAVPSSRTFKGWCLPVWSSLSQLQNLELASGVLAGGRGCEFDQNTFSNTELDHWWTFASEGQQFSDIWHNVRGTFKKHVHKDTHTYAACFCSS